MERVQGKQPPCLTASGTPIGRTRSARAATLAADQRRGSFAGLLPPRTNAKLSYVRTTNDRTRSAHPTPSAPADHGSSQLLMPRLGWHKPPIYNILAEARSNAPGRAKTLASSFSGTWQSRFLSNVGVRVVNFEANAVFSLADTRITTDGNMPRSAQGVSGVLASMDGGS
jgi:hypothetical protein